MTYNFDTDEQLGKAVTSMQVFCKLTKSMPVPSYDYIVGRFGDPQLHGLAGHKWSRLCGFTFKSAVESKYPVFQFVYVPKLRGNLTRNDKGLHGWYCWKYIAADDRDVMSLDSMLNKYNFNVNKFVHSDVFDKYVPQFVANIRFALDNQVKELCEQTVNPSKRKELEFYVKAVRTSLDDINNVKEIVSYDEYKRRHENNADDDSNFYAAFSDPKAGHARVAYNADKTYGLKNLDNPHTETSQEQAKS